jgi:predicted nuclease of predicted toxin-antitoxin system
MAYRLILDENVEHEVFHRLENYGHNVEHVDFVAELGKGTADHPIARYSLNTDRVIVTYDDDFVLDVDEELYRAVLYVDNAMLSVEQVADIIHAISQHYPQSELQGLAYAGEDWL